MPAAYSMSWNRTQRRWEKMYRGQRFWVTCSDLGLPDAKHTKEDSYQAANEWWTRKRAGLDAADLTQRRALEAHDYPRVPELRERADYLRRHDAADAADVIDAEIISIKSLPPADVPVLDADTAARVAGFEKLTGLDLSTVDPHVLDAALNRVEPVWTDRAKRDTSTPPDRTVGALAARWLARKKEKVQDGNLTIHGADNADYRIRHFLDLIGRDSDPNTLTADLWERFRDRLEGRVRKQDGKGGEWAKNQWHATRNFVETMYSSGVLNALPRNWTTCKLRVGGAGGDIQTFTVEELGTLWSAARGQYRLHLLLGLNCGFKPWDVSNLNPKNIDLDAGTLTHRRTKTKHKTGNAPTVKYKLWPETVVSLREYMTAAGDVALLNADGRPWIRYTTRADGKLSEADGIRQWWDRIVKKAGIPHRPFGSLRKTGASTLEGHKDFGRMTTYYLANTPGDVTRQSYAKASDALLAEALDWLRGALGIDKLPL